MEKSLSERIATRERKKTSCSKNKVSFLAQRQDIIEALENGWSVITIWETLHVEGKISFTYNTFRLYISRFIEGYKKTSTKRITLDKRQNKRAENQSAIKPTTTMPAFTFNPKFNPEDLF